MDPNFTPRIGYVQANRFDNHPHMRYNRPNLTYAAVRFPSVGHAFPTHVGCRGESRGL